MAVETDVASTSPAPVDTNRRWFLRSAGALGAAAGATLAVPGAAEAATSTRRVTKYVALSWTYNARTHVTTVRRSRKTTVTARFVGTKVYERNAKRVWVRVPYVWSSRRKALVYSRYLHLALIRAAKPAPPRPAVRVSPYVSTSMVWHLARRATYGPSPTLIKEINALGTAKWLDQQLAPTTVNDSAFDAYVQRIPHLNESISATVAAIKAPNSTFSDWDAAMNVSAAHIARALWSKRQLLAVLEDFWGNHFNVTNPGDSTNAMRAHYARVLRNGALGKFSALLTNVIRHPAMIVYLNNDDSDKDHPNENLGREVLELHTVGVETAYGEAGVLDSARILTGLSINWDTKEFLYRRDYHDIKPVRVLGFTSENGSTDGKLVVNNYLNYLAHHPATAKRLARKLAVRFVRDDPPQALVDRLAAVYLKNDTAIAPVLRALFLSPEFASSAGAKQHRPFERLAATVRILGYGPDKTGTDAPRDLYWLSNDTDNAPLAWPQPDGYPDVAPSWSSTASTLTSWNARRGIVQQWYPNSMTGATAAVEADVRKAVLPTLTATTTYAQFLGALHARLFGLPLPTRHRDSLLAFLAPHWPPNPTATTVLHADHAAASWQLGALVTALLDSPYGTRR